MLAGSLDDAVPPEHQARVIWEVVGRFDLAKFYEPIKAREGSAGRDPIDPKILIGLWLLAYTQNIVSGREIERLCEHHAVYRWMCGTVSVNYHTLNDFRGDHLDALDELLTQMLGLLIFNGSVQVEQITQDGTKVRASAGTQSFSGREKLEKCIVEAKAHIADLGRLADESPQQAASRQQAARERIAADRLKRLNEAMETLKQIEEAKAKQKNKPSKHTPAKASSTDPDARKLKMPDGGYRPAYNVQLAQDPVSGAIVGVAVSPDGNDRGQTEPMRKRIEERTGQKVKEHIYDGGCLRLEDLDKAAEQDVKIYAPVPKPRKEGQDRFEPRKDDSQATAEWRQRMGTPEAKPIYKQRAPACERANADLKTHRGLGRLPVRGRQKVLCAALWSSLAFNLMVFGKELIG